MHVVLVLPVADARPASDVVQGARVPVARRAEPRVLLEEMGTTLPDDVSIRVWDSSAEVRYLVLPERPAGTDDLSEEDLAALVTRDSMIGVQTAVSQQLPDDVALMDGVSALRRDNGELVFSAPWEGRALAIAVAIVEQLDLPWDEFRQRLIAAVAEAPDRPYYESWAVALESLVVGLGLTTPAALDAATPSVRPSL